MFESLGLVDITPRQASVFLGLAIGLFFGVLAQLTQFCLRRAVAGPAAIRGTAQSIWLMALAAAILGTQAAIQFTPLSFASHRLQATDIPLLAIITGGSLFGAGMVLTRGCASRLTVLAGSGNLRAVIVLLVFAVVAHSTLKGVLAPVRTWLGEFTVTLDMPTALSAFPGGNGFVTLVIVVLLVFLAVRLPYRASELLGATLLGLLVPLAWLGTGWLLLDDFDPIPLESLSFTLPHTQVSFWVMASTAVPAGFGVGLIGGVLAGSLITHVLRGQFAWQSFESAGQTGRYLTGAVFMGIGGVLAGGCSVGAGLSGVSTLSLAALVALVSMITSASISAQLLKEPR